MSIIKKLEALTRYELYTDVDDRSESTYTFMMDSTEGDYISYDDLRAIIEEYKATEQEPVGYMSQESLTNLINGNDVIVGKQSELRDVSVFTHPQLSDETVKDAERYRWLCNNASNSFILTKNDDHKTNYVTAKTWIEEYAPEHFTDDNSDEIQKMKDTDTIWRLQVYPDTPIGFYVWHGATLSYAIDEAMKADND